MLGSTVAYPVGSFHREAAEKGVLQKRPWGLGGHQVGYVLANDLMAKKSSGTLGCIGHSFIAEVRKVILLLCPALVRPVWSAASSSGLHSTRKTGNYWNKNSEWPERCLRAWRICHVRRG